MVQKYIKSEKKRSTKCNTSHLVQHLFIPILKSFRFWHFLLRWMSMEYVVIPLGRWTGPYMTPHIPQYPHVIKISYNKRLSSNLVQRITRCATVTKNRTDITPSGNRLQPRTKSGNSQKPVNYKYIRVCTYIPNSISW